MKRLIVLWLFVLLVMCSPAYAVDFLATSNFAYSTLTSIIGNASGEDATFTVTTGEGARFPTSGEFLLIIYSSSCSQPSTCSAREIIKIKSRTNDTLTIKARNQEGTTHTGDWAIGSRVDHTFTAGMDAEVKAAINALAAGGSGTCLSFTTNDTSPSVSGSGCFKTANTSDIEIVRFDDIVNGGQFVVLINDNHTTVQCAGDIKCNNGVNWVPASGDWLYCRSDGTYSYCMIGNERDPKVDAVTSGYFCKGTGTKISCTLAEETDPKIGTLTNNKWCNTNGSIITCTQDAPTGAGDITDIFDCASGDCSGLIAGASDYIDMSGASYSKPSVHLADCSGVTGIGRYCTDTVTKFDYIGDGTNAVKILKANENGTITGSMVASGTITPNKLTQLVALVDEECVVYDSAGGGGLKSTTCGSPGDLAGWDKILYDPVAETLRYGTARGNWKITEIKHSCVSGTSMVFKFQECNNTGANCLDIHTATTCTSGAAVGTISTFTEATCGSTSYCNIDSDDIIKLVISTVTGVVDEFDSAISFALQ